MSMKSNGPGDDLPDLAAEEWLELEALSSMQKEKYRLLVFAAHLALGSACTVALMFGMPHVPPCTVAGAIFGFNEGFIISRLGSFLLVCWGPRSSAEKRVGSGHWLRALTGYTGLLARGAASSALEA